MDHLLLASLRRCCLGPPRRSRSTKMVCTHLQGMMPPLGPSLGSWGTGRCGGIVVVITMSSRSSSSSSGYGGIIVVIIIINSSSSNIVSRSSCGGIRWLNCLESFLPSHWSPHATASATATALSHFCHLIGLRMLQPVLQLPSSGRLGGTSTEAVGQCV